jgi:ABC-type glycerol-3-phosphate transport system permease component
MNCLIPLAVNLVGMLLIYSLMAFALAGLNWRGRGIIPTLVMITIAGLFWSAPAILAGKSFGPVAYSLWFGNWLVSGFSVVILCLTVRWIPRQLEETARLDGCGRFEVYHHVVLPLVRRELGLIALLTLMATSGLCWAALTMPGGPSAFQPPWFAWLSPISIGRESNPSLALFLGEVMAGSMVLTLPVILIFFFAKRYFQHATDAGETGAVPSLR